MKASLRGQLPPDFESALIGPIIVRVVHSHFALISFDGVFGGYLIILPKIFTCFYDISYLFHVFL